MATSREFYGSGIVPKISDTSRMLLVKWLLSLIVNKGATNVRNYPLSGDTKQMLRIKILRELDGI